MKLHFFANEDKQRALTHCERLVAEARRLGLSVVPPGEAEAVVALGGDGTILKAVREFPGVPVLGFNLGGLGYLSSVEEKDFSRALVRLTEGRFRIAARSMLRMGDIVALNDIVIVREMTGHAAVLDLSVNGSPATRYLADGLIVATPTGSTAYSLSAGGPVLMPDTACLVVTPMNPHALGIRPLVLGDSAVLSIASSRRGDRRVESLGVYADGVSVRMLKSGEAVEIRRAEATAKVIELEGYDPHEVLSRKLGWSGTALR